MTKIHARAPDEVYERADHIIECFYPELKAAGLKLDIISIADDEDDVPALTHQGYPCDAVVRIIPVKSRIMGRGDAEITIDEWNWLNSDSGEKDALLDHEIHHLLLVPNAKRGGAPKLDDCGRPKLKMKKHDHQFGWFTEIAKRHGAASGEVRQARMLFLAGRQIYFGFAENLTIEETK